MATKKPDDIRSTTRTGYVIPHQPEIHEYDGERRAARPEPVSPEPVQSPSIPAKSAPPPIEIEYIQESDIGAVRDQPMAMLEIVTRNRIYRVDTTLKCVAVINRATGQTEPTHSLMGTRLTGGERRSKSTGAVEIYYPLPMPGTEAVFRNESKRNGQYGHTSTIERVVLRQRKVRVGAIESAQSWDEITGRFTIR